MSPPTPAAGLFETHLTVRDVALSVAFYRDVVGLPVATEMPERNVAFHWIGAPGQSMLGLWGVGSSPNVMELHTAFSARSTIPSEAPERLRESGVTPLSRPGDERPQRDRLDAGRHALLPRSRWPLARVPDDAGRRARPGGGNRAAVGVAEARLVI